jgi:hypothetical protein
MATIAAPFVPKQKVKIAKGLLEFVELDASITEGHSFDTVITDHPVEAGANVSDHVRLVPSRLKISGIVSNQPLSLTQINLNPTRADEAFATLLSYQEDAQLLTVTTTLQVYEDMLLKSLSVTRDKDTGNIVAMDLDFQQVVTVESSFAAVAPKDTKQKSGQNKKQVGKKATRPVKRVSVFRGAIRAVAGK